METAARKLQARDPQPGDAVPDAVKPPPGNPRFPLFDGLRAIAALSIVVTHVAGATHANDTTWWGHLTARLNVGVTIFFLISGFLLYRPFVAARMQGRAAPRIRDFYRRRVLRIVPAYWLALTVLAIWPGLSLVFSDHFWVYYGFLQVYNRFWILGGLGIAWSLCIEVTFYLLLPFYAMAVARWLAGRAPERQARAELWLLAALALAAVAGRTIQHSITDQSIFAFTLPGTFDWFALGMGLAVVSAVAARGSAPAPGAGPGGAGAVAVLAGGAGDLLRRELRRGPAAHSPLHLQRRQLAGRARPLRRRGVLPAAARGVRRRPDRAAAPGPAPPRGGLARPGLLRDLPLARAARAALQRARRGPVDPRHHVPDRGGRRGGDGGRVRGRQLLPGGAADPALQGPPAPAPAPGRARLRAPGARRGDSLAATARGGAAVNR